MMKRVRKTGGNQQGIAKLPEGIRDRDETGSQAYGVVRRGQLRRLSKMARLQKGAR
jgi:hypothetical protein